MRASAQDAVQLSVLEEEMNDTKARITLLRQQMDFLMEDHASLRVEVRVLASKPSRGPRKSQSNVSAAAMGRQKSPGETGATPAGSAAIGDASAATTSFANAPPLPSSSVSFAVGAGSAAATASGPPAEAVGAGDAPPSGAASALSAVPSERLDASMALFMRENAAAAASPGAPTTPGAASAPVKSDVTKLVSLPEESAVASSVTFNSERIEGGQENTPSEEAQERLEAEMAAVRGKMDKFSLTRAAWKDGKQEALNTALRTWRGPKWLILRVLTSHVFQCFSFVAVFIHIISMAMEVDLPDGSEGHTHAVAVLYGCTTFFLFEVSLRLMIIPKLWRSKTELVDLLVCALVFVLETMDFFDLDLVADLGWVLVLRLMRIGRFLWKVREHDSLRPVRIILVAIRGTIWSLFWITVLLLVIFFTNALVLRTLTKGGNITADEEVSTLLEERFPTVPHIMLTLLEVFLNAFDYSAVIIRPLVGSEHLALVGVFFTCYQMFMQLCLVNFVTGVFVEQISKDAAKSDAAVERKSFVQRDISYGVLAETFQKIDRKGEGVIALEDLNVALVENPEIEPILRVKESCGGTGTPERWFAELDDFGEGTGELSFTDFVFGTVKHRMKSDSFEQLIFDHQMTKFIKSSAQTGKSVSDLDSFVHNHAGQVDTISTMLQQQKGRHTGELKNVRSRLNALQLKIESLAAGLNIPTGASSGALPGEAKSLPNIKHVREAGEISVLMGSLKEQVQRATEAATTHSVNTSQILDEAIARFRKELKHEVQSQLMILSAGSAQVASDAVAAARVLKAATVAVSNPAMAGSQPGSALGEAPPSGSGLSTFRSQGGGDVSDDTSR